MDLGLKGKVAVVVGGSSNIGRATSIRLAQEGAKVVIGYSSNDKKAAEALAAVQAEGGEALLVKGDMTTEENVDNLFKSALNAFGRLDILIYSAMLWPTNPVTDIPLSEWQRTLEVNLTGVFLTNRWVTRYSTFPRRPPSRARRPSTRTMQPPKRAWSPSPFRWHARWAQRASWSTPSLPACRWCRDRMPS